LDVLDSGEHECGLGEFTDAAGLMAGRTGRPRCPHCPPQQRSTRRLHQLPPGDAVLGKPRFRCGQAVQLADPVQGFELGDEPGPVLAVDGEQVRGR